MREWCFVLLAACSYTTPRAPIAGDAAQIADAPITVTDDAAVDAMVDAMVDAGSGGDLCLANAAACVTAGGACISGACTINQASAAGVTCPSGMPCHVSCVTGESSCEQGLIDCGSSTSCVVACNGDNACKNMGVTCANTGSCAVNCEGANACELGGVDCANTASCAVRCIGGNACKQGPGSNSVDCGASSCTVTCDGGNACEDGLDPGNGTCASHCCNGGCLGGACPTNDAVCI